MNRLSPEKAKAIAIEFVANNYDKVKTLLNLGYKESYARSGKGLKIYDNVLVKNEIAKLQLKTGLKLEISRESQMLDLETAKAMATELHKPAAYVAACREQNAMLGFHRDLAPNPEKEAKRLERMDRETRKMAENAAKERLDQEAKEQGDKVLEGFYGDCEVKDGRVVPSSNCPEITNPDTL